jgi:hypothetical protein
MSLMPLSLLDSEDSSKAEISMSSCDFIEDIFVSVGSSESCAGCFALLLSFSFLGLPGCSTIDSRKKLDYKLLLIVYLGLQWVAWAVLWEFR